MVSFEESLALVQDLVNSADDTQLEFEKQRIKKAFRKEYAALCFQLVVNHNYTLEHIAEWLYLGQSAKDLYNEQELELMVSSVMEATGSEAQQNFYAEQLEKHIPGFNDLIYGQLGDLQMNPEQIVQFLQKGGKV